MKRGMLAFVCFVFLIFSSSVQAAEGDDFVPKDIEFESIERGEETKILFDENSEVLQENLIDVDTENTSSLETSSSVFDSQAFTDVPKLKWYTIYIEEVVLRELMNGYPDNTFLPDNYMTRAEATKVLSSLYYSLIDPSIYNPFNDIGNHWARNNILWAYNKGIVNGTSSTTFEPNKYVTRQDFAVMITRFCSNAELFRLPYILELVIMP